MDIVDSTVTANTYTVQQPVQKDSVRTQNVQIDIPKSAATKRDAEERLHVCTDMTLIKI